MTGTAHEQLRGLVHASARFLDDHAYEKFTQLFADDGEYRVETAAPECPQPMVWMLMNRDELTERLASESKHEWKIARVPLQTRLVAVDFIDVSSNNATTSSSFCLYHTNEDGSSEVFAVGRYEDQWNKKGEDWRLAKRRVDLKTRLFAMPSPIPI